MTRRSIPNPPMRSCRSAYSPVPQAARLLHTIGRAGGRLRCPTGPAAGGAEQAQPSGLGAVLSGIGSVLGDIFGTTRPRRTRLSTGQVIAREVTRSVSNRVAGQIAADIGKSIGGKMGSSVGRAIVRGT